MRRGQVRVCWFAYGPSEGSLRVSVEQAQRSFPTGTTFTVFADAACPLSPQGVEWLEARGVVCRLTDWPRGGNLNGLPCVQGILECLAGVAQSPRDVIWKLDADTLVGDSGVLLDWFHDANVVGAGLRCPWALGWWGISYALRAGVIAPLAEIIDQQGEAGLADLGLTQAHEDMVISRTLARHESPSRLRSWYSSRQGAAFIARNYREMLPAEDLLARWGVVTFGNRWQLAGSSAERHARELDDMRRAAAVWCPETSRAWRTQRSIGLWQCGVPLTFGKSCEKRP